MKRGKQRRDRLAPRKSVGYLFGRPERLQLEQLESRLLLAGQVVISEIMYHPPSDDVRDEWIELYNSGDAAVDVRDYRFNDGVEFTLPSRNIAAGGYLVVAADLQRFQLYHPAVPNVVGSWLGQLSNSGESIELVDSNGSQVDKVTYADSGNWGQRRAQTNGRDRGWVWEALHDGEGRSLELVNDHLDNALAHYWESSQTVGGTPGRPNSVAVENAAPAIVDLEHWPIIPTSSDPVTISVQVRDERIEEVSVSLFYQVSTMEPEPFRRLVMFDDGQHRDGAARDGLFAAELPPHPHETVVEFYVMAQDASGEIRTYPGPTDDQGGQETNALYQVDDTDWPREMPLYRTIMTVPDLTRFKRMNRELNLRSNATFVATLGGQTDYRYNVGVRYRGHGSRQSFDPTNNRVSFPTDRDWLGRNELNLNVQVPIHQIAASAVFSLAGLPAADARAVRYLTNGRERTVLPFQRAYYAELEDLNNEWAARHFPLDSEGNVYRAKRPDESIGQGSGLVYFGEDPADYGSYEKKTNVAEADWSDVIQLTRVLNNEPDETFLTEFSKIVNVDQWLRTFATTALIGYFQAALFSGHDEGGDYALYRGEHDRRFVIIPHDTANTFQDRFRLYPPTRNPALNRLISFPEIAQRLYVQYHDLIENVLTEERLRQTFEQIFAGIEPSAEIDRLVDVVRGNAQSFLISTAKKLTVTSVLPQQFGLLRTQGAHSELLQGRANPLQTARVLVDGNEAKWNPLERNWEISNLPLIPGMNRIRVQAIDPDGQETESTHIDIWRDTGNYKVITDDIEHHTTWASRREPYLISGDVIVQADTVLTVEPGTTVFFDRDSSLTVHGQLVVSGTATEPVWFTRIPTVEGTWNGIRFIDTVADNRIRHAVIQYAATDAGSISLENSSLELDQVEFVEASHRSVRAKNSSLLVRNSLFGEVDEPDEFRDRLYPGQHVWIEGVPRDGKGVLIESSRFGRVPNNTEAITFRGPLNSGSIPRFIDNTLDGGGNGIAVTGDAYIEGNIFQGFSTTGDIQEERDSRSNAIVVAVGHATVVRNVFEDIDQAVIVKDGGFVTFTNNTVVRTSRAGMSFDLRDQTDAPGRGAYVDGNIFFETPLTFDNLRESTELTVSRSIVSPEAVSLGVDNLAVDPWFVDPLSDYRLRPGSPASGAGPNALDMGAIVDSGPSIRGEPELVTSETNATLHVGGPGITDYRYRINDGPFSVAIPVERSIELSGLTDGTYTVDVVGQTSAGVWTEDMNATGSQTWTVDTNSILSLLRFNEILASNDSAWEHEGVFPDAVELFNGSAMPIDLSGMSVTDDPRNRRRFVFPQGTTIPARSYLVLRADSSSPATEANLGFGLSADGEGLYLFDTIERGQIVLDSVEYGIQATDLSIGRDRDGVWAINRPTLGFANRPLPLEDPLALRISEWLTHPVVVYEDDFVELHNPTPAPISLGGLFVSDHPNGWPDRHRLDDLSFIGPNEYTVLQAGAGTSLGANRVSFGLSRDQDSIALFDEESNLIDSVRYAPQQIDTSQGLVPDGGPALASFQVATPGVANSVLPDENLQAVLDGLRITELMYNPLGGSQFEFIELQNTSNVPIKLNDVALSDAVQFTFADLTLQPREYTVVVNNMAAFQSRYGDQIPVTGEYAGNLNNGGERIVLESPAVTGENVLRFRFDDWWYPSTDGTGFSMVIENALAPRGDWGHRLAWRSGSSLHGSPGTADLALADDAIVINEVLADTELTANRQIELHNTTGRTIDISGWYLSDDSANLTKYQVPAGTWIRSNRFIVFNEQQHFGDGFQLSRHGGQIVLASSDAVGTVAGYQHSIYYGPGSQNETLGRHVTSEGRADFVALSSSTFDSTNSTPRVGPIVLSEVMYNPPDGGQEFVELLNTAQFSVPLYDPSNPANTWRLAGDTEYVFPPGVRMGPNQRALVVGIDPVQFRTTYGVPAETIIFGPFSRPMPDNVGDIQILRPGTPDGDIVPAVLVERIRYQDQFPWPVHADGLGASLIRLTKTDYGDDPTNWTRGNFAGTPGTENQGPDTTPPSAPQISSARIVSGPGVQLTWRVAFDPESDIASYNVYRNGDVIASTTATTFEDRDPPQNRTLRYTVQAINTEGLVGEQSAVVERGLVPITSVAAISDTEVVVSFGDRMDRLAGEDVIKYAINFGVEVLSATMSRDLRSVTLRTTPLSTDVSYRIVIQSMPVSDRTRQAELPSGSSVQFEYVKGVPGFTVRAVQPSDPVRRLNGAQREIWKPDHHRDVLAAKTTIVANIDYLDDDGHDQVGLFDINRVFPVNSVGDDDNLVLRATTTLIVSSAEAGTWTFAVATASEDVTDDQLAGSPTGFQLLIDDQPVMNIEGHGSPDERLRTIFLSEGSHDVDLLYYSHEGPAEIELLAARGVHGELDQSEEWHLLGDTDGGGLFAVTDALPPAIVDWQRLSPVGSQAFEFHDLRVRAGLGGGQAYLMPMGAGQLFSLRAIPSDPDAVLSLTIRDPNGIPRSITSSRGGVPIWMANARASFTGEYRLSIVRAPNTT